MRGDRQEVRAAAEEGRGEGLGVAAALAVNGDAEAVPRELPIAFHVGRVAVVDGERVGGWVLRGSLCRFFVFCFLESVVRSILVRNYVKFIK